MSDIIKFADWQAFKALIQEGNAAVSGMTAAEAQAALGASERSGLYTYSAITAAGANNVINFPNAATAAEAAAEYVAAGGTTSGAGAATAATGAAKTAANFTVIEGGAAGTSGVAGLLAMPLPTAAAALAPLAGAALGVGLYELNPDLWTKISKTLLPFCYEDSELLPVTVDGDGNTYFSENVINAFKDVVSTIDISEKCTATATDAVSVQAREAFPNGIKYVKTKQIISKVIGPVTQDGTVTITPTEAAIELYSFSFSYKQAYQGFNTLYINAGITKSISAPDVIYRREFPYNPAQNWSTTWAMKPIRNTDWYLTSSGFEGESQDYYPYIASYPVIKVVDNNVRNDNLLGYIIEFIEKGNITTEPSIEGVSKWKGNPYPESVTPINVLTGYDEEGRPIYTPYFPVTTPIGDPGVSTDPSVNPDPTVNPNPAPVIEPYITPSPDPEQYPQSVPPSKPAPLPNPIPSAQPVPDPSADPSQETENTPDDPKSPKPPTDGGESGTTVIPSIPTLPSAATGLLHVYNPTQAQINDFGSWLWTTFSGDLIDTLSKLFNDPMDAVIGLHELYATPSTQGDATIKAGYLDSGISAKLVGNRYTTINCGSIVVEEYYQNYLDYSPYTQVYIYLPFIGIVPVSADDIIGNAVNITYHIDSYTGSCIAVISVAKKGYSSTVYQFQGNCAVEIPITSGYQSSLMGALLGVAGTAISGNPAVGLTAAHIGRAGLGKNAVSHSGSFGSSYGAMGCKIPYIIVRRPVQKKVTDYSKSYGYPAHKMVYIGNCKGYLRAKEVRVTSTKATNVEKEMIVSALKSGVYVK